MTLQMRSKRGNHFARG